MDWTVIKILAFLCAFTVSCTGQGQGSLVNVARGKNCSQSSYYNRNSNLYPAGNAANGNTGGSFGNDNCIRTANSNTDDYDPWWEVDLGKIYPVYGITIYARFGYNTQLTKTQITVDSAECHRIGNQPPPDVYSFNCTSILYGQKVRITRPYVYPDFSLNMCEFQVFVPYDVSDCGVGWYSHNCNLQCSANCGGGPRKNPCHRDTGACFYGCLNNQYRGDQCNQPCDSRCKDAVCKQDTGACLRCEAGTYGNNCAKQCDPRCQGNICNSDSGSCLLNVALNQAASMSSQGTSSGPASNAVNGNTDGNLHADNCIVTGSTDTEPWWQVDLGKKYPVHSITSSAMLNHQPDLFPSTITVDSNRCFRYASRFTIRTPTFSCDSAVYGQVIRINRDYRIQSVQLSLCEFQVWVCTSGFFGDTCDGRCSVSQCAYCDQTTGTDCYECNAGWYNTDCSVPCIATTCKDNQCDKQTGLCTQCNGNFGGDYCTDCAPGFYGQVCIQQCLSPNCLNKACNRTHGRCDACPSGSFGLNCDQSCPQYCKDNQCALTSGRCLSCPVRRWGGSCDQACSTGCDGAGDCDQEIGDCLSCAFSRWGSKCNKECPSGCGGSGQCDARTGHCLSCPAGYWGDFCNNTCLSDKCKNNICNITTGFCVGCKGPNFQLPYCECKDNFYYLSPQCNSCTARCFNNTPCNKTNGHCDKCPPGIAGRSCDQGCPRGTYGQDCAENCGQCRNGDTCNAVTGHCSGCELGWTEPLCLVCVNGRYGASCSETCGQCSGGATCDKTTGECAACPVGVQPPLCKQNCSEGTYGQGCAKKCGSCSTVVDCHHISGKCHGGCARGFTGTLCEEQVQDQPEGGSMGLIGGAIGGLLVAIIIAVIVVVVIVRRRKRAPKPAYDGVSEEMSESRNGIYANANTSTNGSPLSFEPMIVIPTSKAEAVNPPSKPKAAVRPSVKAKPPRTPRDKGAIYENVATLGQEDRTHQGDAGSPKLPPKDKKGKQPKKSDDDAPHDCLTDDEEAVADNADDSLYANEDMYYNVDPASLSLDSLQRQLLNKLRARDKLDAEFQKIPTSDEKATKVNGEREENYMKNRFNSILPYDRNIVALDKIDGDDASDYVNSSFVRGHKSDKAYIAAQGPKNNTVDAFWRMVWQEHVTHIVMLTNLLEHNKWKCFGYWPAKGGKKTYGPIEVAGVHEEQRAHYVIRTFDVAQSGQGKEKRRVQQYHYTSWMDHEVPATTPLVDFWRYIRTRTATDKYPLVVHCSAGVGRTGTFIALDIVIDHAQHETKVSIHDVVRRLRDDRCNMVQNKSQYVFLHEAVLEAYTSLGTRLDLNTFDSVFAQPVESGTVHQRVDKEFETLRQMRSCFTRPVYNNATQDDNRDKNRNPNALPDDRHLVFLTPHVKGRNQYINAVYMSTFLEPRGSILTQLPLPDTLMDIWRLVDGCKVGTIVAIGDVHDAGYDCYWPRKVGETMQTGIYTVTFKSSTMLGTNLASYTLSVDLQDQTDTRSVEVLHYEDWRGEVPGNTTDLIHLLDTLESAQSDRKGNPFLVQCIDGAAKSGLFCALYDVKCRVTQDEEVDVYLAVRRVQSVRPEAVPSVEQYRYCYELIQHYRNSQNVYANA